MARHYGILDNDNIGEPGVTFGVPGERALEAAIELQMLRSWRRAQATALTDNSPVDCELSIAARSSHAPSTGQDQAPQLLGAFTAAARLSELAAGDHPVGWLRTSTQDLAFVGSASTAKGIRDAAK